MQDTFPFLSHANPSLLLSTNHGHDFPSISWRRSLHFPAFSFKPNTTLLLPPTPPKSPEIPSIISSTSTMKSNPQTNFEEKMFYLDSIGIDFLTLVKRHPPIVSAALSDLKSVVDYMTSPAVGFTLLELRRVVSMCPELLTSPLNSHTIPVLTFLFRKAGVEGTAALRRVLSRRPRLLACSVKHQLRPSLYFLQTIGITEIHKHTYLLSCSVENKLIPRIDYFEKLGFSRLDAVSMFRRFPQLFNYSISDSYEPKLKYLLVQMGRDLKEIKEFPQYFSFSLENRIKPRHQACVEKGVRFSLPVLLKTNQALFRDRLEVCCSSSPPLKTSPLYCTKDS